MIPPEKEIENSRSDKDYYSKLAKIRKAYSFDLSLFLNVRKYIAISLFSKRGFEIETSKIYAFAGRPIGKPMKTCQQRLRKEVFIRSLPKKETLELLKSRSPMLLHTAHIEYYINYYEEHRRQFKTQELEAIRTPYIYKIGYYDL